MITIMAYTYNNDELTVFMKAKRDETDPKKRRRYFAPQVVDAASDSGAATDIGREYEFMTGKNPTKFVSITGVPIRAADASKLGSIVGCASEVFDPSKMVQVVYVYNKEHNFVRFATLLAVLYEHQWPLFDDAAEALRERTKFFNGMKHHNARYEAAYIGYLLGYRMNDILAWGHGNGTFKKTKKEAQAIVASCEGFVKDAIASKFIADLTDRADWKTISARQTFRMLA